MSEIRGLPSINPVSPGAQPAQKPQPGEGPGFKDLLKEKVGSPAQIQSEKSFLKFSNHAVERMRSRGISVGEDEMSRMRSAIDKAESKGSKETLVLMGENAFIVNVKNKTVVTAMDRNMMKDNVFTNIDSTVIV